MTDEGWTQVDLVTGANAGPHSCNPHNFSLHNAFKSSPAIMPVLIPA